MTEKTRLKGQTELDRFIENLRADKKSERTIEEYTQLVKMMLKKIGKEPTVITKEDLDEYRLYMANEKGYAPNTMIKYISTIKMFFRFLGMNVAEKLKSPKQPKYLPKYLPEEEVARLLYASRSVGPMQHALITVLYYGGLRRNEVMNLNISNVNFEENIVRVNSGKGNKDGIANLHPDAIKAIKDYLPQRITPDDNSDALFVSQHRKRISKGQIENIVKNCAVKARLNKNVYPHMLRHSLAATMRRHGATLLDIKDQLRHSNITSTIVYAQIENAAVKKAYEKSVPSLSIATKITKPHGNQVQMPSVEEMQRLLDYKYLNGDLDEEKYIELKNRYSSKPKNELSIYA